MKYTTLFTFSLLLFTSIAMPWEEVAYKCKSNIGLVKEPIRGIMLEHHGCGCGACGREKGQAITNYQPCAVLPEGWLFIHARPGSLWANEQTVALTDELIDAMIEHYGLKKDIPIISNGYSMGGMCALAWPVFTKHRANVRAVFANCPVTDLVAQYDYVCTFTNSWGHYLRKTIEDGYPAVKGPAGREALKVRSPRHIVDKLPDVPYYINHGTADKAVVKETHADVFVPILKAAGRDVAYFISEGSDHCGISKENRPKWDAALKAEMAKAAPPVEPGIALIDETWANGWSAWTVSNLDNVVTMETKGNVLHLENKRPKGDKGASFFTIRSGLFKVEPGQDFAVLMESRGNLDMRTPVTTFRAKENQIRAFIPATAVLWYTADKQPLLAQDASGVKLPTGSSFAFSDMCDAFTLTRHFDSVPPGAAYAALQIGGKYPSFHPGSWLELRRLALKLRANKTDNWDFGDVAAPELERVSASPDPNPSAPFVFAVKDASKIVKLVCKLDGKEVKEEELSPVPSNLKPQTKYRISHEPWAKDSLHALAVEATDAAGNIARETLVAYCGEPAKGHKLSVRDDGMTLVDGKPYFPIGTFGARLAPPNGYDPDRMLGEFAANGFNYIESLYSYRTETICHYNTGSGKQKLRPKAEMDRFMEAVHRHGFLIAVEPSVAVHGTEQRFKETEGAVRYFRNFPDVLFYYIGDDTASNVTPEVLKNVHNICHAMDDLRFTTQADANDYPGRYQPYAKATDVFMIEIYPFRNAEHEPNGLAQVISNCDYAFDGLKKSGASMRSIWSIPQAFSGWGLWKKFPSRELIRAQTYLAIIHGCRGITYYSYFSYTDGAEGYGHNPKHTEDLYSTTRELRAIYGDLTSRDAKVQPKLAVVAGPKKDPGDNASVTCLLKEGEKGPLLIAASSMMKGPSVWVEIPLDATRVETLFENGRKVTFKNGVLMDSFGPGEVHVYRIR